MDRDNNLERAARAGVLYVERSVLIVLALGAAIIFAALGIARYAHAQAGPVASPANTQPWQQFGTHIVSGGVGPAATSCGTGPAVLGSDVAGSVLTGTGATACTLIFATAYNQAPSCRVSGRDHTPSFTVSATALTLTTGIASSYYDWNCTARVGG